jgi:hypothetical protein
MNYDQLSSVLSKVAGQHVYVRCVPEVLDFTDKEAQHDLHFCVQGGDQFTVTLNDENTPLVLAMLGLSVFGKGMKILAWNWKNLVSYVLAKTGRHYPVDGSIIDLKVIESYGGKDSNKNLKPPVSLIEAMNRLKNVVAGGVWKEIEPVYKKVHLPLITTVIPHLEAVGINDPDVEGRVHAYYEIDGQENGRLKCSKQYKRGYVPHAMTPEVRKALKPRDYDELFMLFDFQGMEVFMLTWMSKDPLLLELCEAKDIYAALYEKVVGKPATGKEEREKAKKFFLPVIYGQSAFMLAKSLGVSQTTAETIIHRIGALFPTASAWIEAYEKQLAEAGFAKDIFGKRRPHFEEGREFAVRNFAVQSPGALVCLEKLVQLYVALKGKTDLAYTVHDGYVVYATKDNWQQVYKTGSEVLAGESSLCSGLRLRVACCAGRNLDDLKPLARKGDG